MMRRLAFTFPCLALLTACNQQSDDPYRWKAREIDRDVVTITKQELPSQAALASMAEDMNVRFSPGEEGQGFGIVQRSAGRCTIYYVSPDVSKTAAWAGHEMAHCFYGNWHK